MNKLRMYAERLIIGSLTIISCLQISDGQLPCCSPPPMAPTSPRFAIGTTVNVYIDSTSGFTDAEMTQIKAGLEDWNGQPNGSQVQFNVTITSTMPSSGDSQDYYRRLS
jgi:hypothetical protein